MPRALLTLLLTALFILAPPPPAPAQSIDPLAEGRGHLNEGRFDEAYLSFYEVFKQAPDHPEVNFLLGRAAFESGRLEEAVMAYDRVLTQNPTATRVKLELARTYLQLGSRELAKQYFKEVLATNPPEAVWQNIQKFLAAIEAAEKRHFVNGLITVAVGHDDNIRTAPFDFPFINGMVSFTKTSNYLLNTTLLLNHVYRSAPGSPWSWKSTLINHNALNETATDLNINLYGLSSGPSWQHDKFLLQGSLLANQINLDSDRYLGIIGVNTSLTWLYSQHFFLNGGLTLQNKKFYQDGGKDSANTALNFGPVYVNGKNRFSLIGSYEKENASVDLNNTYDRRGLAFRYDRQLPLEFNAYASIKLEKSDYSGLDPIFNVVRSDKKTFFNLGLSRTCWQSADQRQSLISQIAYARTEADSNVGLYEYNKNVVTLAVTYTF